MLFFGGDIAVASNADRTISPDYLVWLKSQLAKRNLELVVLLVPTKYSVYGPLLKDPPSVPPSDLPLRRLAERLEAENVFVVNVTTALRKQAADDLSRNEYVYFIDDTRLERARGIGVAAPGVVRRLESEIAVDHRLGASGLSGGALPGVSVEPTVVGASGGPGGTAGAVPVSLAMVESASAVTAAASALTATASAATSIASCAASIFSGVSGGAERGGGGLGRAFALLWTQKWKVPAVTSSTRFSMSALDLARGGGGHRDVPSAIWSCRRPFRGREWRSRGVGSWSA